MESYTVLKLEDPLENRPIRVRKEFLNMLNIELAHDQAI